MTEALVKQLLGTIPITANSRTPEGETITDDDDLILQDVNLLQAKRYNQFIGDGTSTEYYLDTTGLDSASVYLMTATVNGSTLIENIDFTVNRTTGVVTFNTAPAAPSDDGDSNVIITLSKTVVLFCEGSLNTHIALFPGTNAFICKI